MSDHYRVNIEVSGNINGEDFTGKGHSIGDPALGNPSVTITYSNVPGGSNVLSNFIAMINMLSTLFSREIPPAKGFLSLTGGDYGFSRSVEGKNILLNSSGSMQRLNRNNLLLLSNVFGKVAHPLDMEIGKWEGVQLPDGPGRVREVMVIPIRHQGMTPENLYVVTSTTVVIFCLRNALISESMGHHDSEIADDGFID